MIYWIVLGLIYFLPFSILQAEYSSYDILPITNSGLSGLGVNDISVVYNPNNLSESSKQMEIGFTQSFYKDREFPLLFAPFHFFYKWNSSQGLGIDFYSPYRSLKNSETRLLYYSGNLVYSYAWKEIFISLGIGPRIAWRGAELSKWSLGGVLSLGYSNPSFSISILYHSSGSFSYRAYRESDELKEKLPDFLFLGISKNLSSSYLVYFELGRIFFEFSKFTLNQSNEKPNLERGVGGDIEPSLGLEYTLNEKVKMKLGLGWVGEYDETGKNRRGVRVSVGNSFYPISEERFYIKWSYVNHAIFSKKGGYTPENSFSVGLGYLW